MAAFWAVFIFGGSGPAITAHGSLDLKVILMADSIRSWLLAWFGSPIVKKIPKYHPPNVYGYVEI
jgi:hypothetical protein